MSLCARLAFAVWGVAFGQSVMSSPFPSNLNPKPLASWAVSASSVCG